MMGASFLTGVFTFVTGICLAFRGQKVFFTPTKVEEYPSSENYQKSKADDSTTPTAATDPNEMHS